MVWGFGFGMERCLLPLHPLDGEARGSFAHLLGVEQSKRGQRHLRRCGRIRGAVRAASGGARLPHAVVPRLRRLVEVRALAVLIIPVPSPLERVPVRVLHGAAATPVAGDPVTLVHVGTPPRCAACAWVRPEGLPALAMPFACRPFALIPVACCTVKHAETLLLAAHPRAVVFHAEFSRLVLPEGAEAVALVVQPLALVLVSAGVRQGALAVHHVSRPLALVLHAPHPIHRRSLTLLVSHLVVGLPQLRGVRAPLRPCIDLGPHSSSWFFCV
mmetsp:Transcript_8982/g.14274  ORF Transcript_8982/g.14274 Transcript_8982/m.14274 type:complete len:272 (+) Transcript_8982:110-925(+)